MGGTVRGGGGESNGTLNEGPRSKGEMKGDIAGLTNREKEEKSDTSEEKKKKKKKQTKGEEEKEKKGGAFPDGDKGPPTKKKTPTQLDHP